MLKIFIFTIWIWSIMAKSIDERKIFSSNPMENEGLFEGDIVGIDPESKNAITKTLFLWSNGVVYYQIHSNLREHERIIREAMNQIEDETDKCLFFIESKGQGNYISFEKNSGCYSSVGMVGGKQTISLGNGCHLKSIILHEICHALGLFHEQSRSDRDLYLKIHYENIIEGKQGNFKKLKPYQNFLMSSFDYDSIMLYNQRAFSRNGKITMEYLDKDVIPKNVFQKNGPSKNDFLELKSIYSCKGYTRPPYPKFPEFSCSFDEPLCDFNFRNNMNRNSTQVVSENGNRYLKTNNIETFNKIASRMYGIYYANQTICVSFKYRFKPSLSKRLLVQVKIANGFIWKQFDFNGSETYGWRHRDLEFTVPSKFKVVFVFWLNESKNSTFDIDDALLRYHHCKGQ